MYATGSVLFSATHVALMVLIRSLVYHVAGLRYSPPPSDFLYEYRKDLLTYVLLAGIFWVFA